MIKAIYFLLESVKSKSSMCWDGLSVSEHLFSFFFIPPHLYITVLLFFPVTINARSFPLSPRTFINPPSFLPAYLSPVKNKELCCTTSLLLSFSTGGLVSLVGMRNAVLACFIFYAFSVFKVAFFTYCVPLWILHQIMKTNVCLKLGSRASRNMTKIFFSDF